VLPEADLRTLLPTLPLVSVPSPHGSWSRTELLEVEAIFLSSAGLVFPGRRQPLMIIPVRGTLPDFLDLTTASIQRALHTSLSELTGHWRIAQETGEIPPTQQLARAAHDTGTIAGLYFTSAKNPAMGRGIAAFADRLVAGRHSLEVIDPNGVFNQRLPYCRRGSAAVSAVRNPSRVRNGWPLCSWWQG
jgi:hypothetical protein